MWCCFLGVEQGLCKIGGTPCEYVGKCFELLNFDFCCLKKEERR